MGKMDSTDFAAGLSGVMGVADETYECGRFLDKRLLQLKSWRIKPAIYSVGPYDAKKDCANALGESGDHIDVYKGTTHYKTLKKQKAVGIAFKEKSLEAAAKRSTIERY